MVNNIYFFKDSYPINVYKSIERNVTENFFFSSKFITKFNEECQGIVLTRCVISFPNKSLL